MFPNFHKTISGLKLLGILSGSSLNLVIYNRCFLSLSFFWTWTVLQSLLMVENWPKGSDHLNAILKQGTGRLQQQQYNDVHTYACLAIPLFFLVGTEGKNKVYNRLTDSMFVQTRKKLHWDMNICIQTIKGPQSIIFSLKPLFGLLLLLLLLLLLANTVF